MSEMDRINPTAPIWPTRPIDKDERNKRSKGKAPRRGKTGPARSKPDKGPRLGHIDELA